MHGSVDSRYLEATVSAWFSGFTVSGGHSECMIQWIHGIWRPQWVHDSVDSRYLEATVGAWFSGFLYRIFMK